MDDNNHIDIRGENTKTGKENKSTFNDKKEIFSWIPIIFYSVSGIFLLVLLSLIFNTYFLRLKIESAVVSTPIETIISPVNGYIIQMYIDLNERVKKGRALLKIENIELQRDYQLAQIKLEESKLTVNYYQQLLANEQQRLKVYKDISKNRLRSAKTLINMSQQEVFISQRSLERFKSLHDKKYISEMNLELEQAKYDSAQEKLKNSEALYNMEKNSLNALKSGFYFTGNKAEGIERDLNAELDAAKQRVQLNEHKVRVYRNLIKRLTLKAPFNGKVTKILKSKGNTAENTKPLLLIEKSGADKEIIAYLTQNEVVHLGASKQVKIYIPSSGKVYHGEITKIDRTEGFVDEIKAQYRWRDFQIDRSATVNISVNKKEQKAFAKHAFSGMPVVVYFPKKIHFF
ncbi:HlyD family secretion protein [Legionella saoudiensis]|uniref:HlyD family secretion protein n=1 Tax=Legionella saoudiensis TaxID=1750561 RepID=UPI000730D88F|nr:HlyD family efflux transporter periplasmic adaptor subunit [Legionella saoudiensis]